MNNPKVAKPAGVCENCTHSNICNRPCAPVEAYLTEDNKSLHEKNISGGRTMAHPRWPEVHESKLQAEYDDSGKPKYGDIFTTETESAFASYDPKLTRTTVFIHHLFLGQSYKDIAAMLDTDAEHIRTIYKDAKTRLLKALNVMDTRQAYKDDVKARLRISEKATGKMPKTHKWFLLNKVFGLLPREIAEIYGANLKTVCARIKDVADRVITGKVIFMNPTDDEIKKAEARIDKKAQRDAEYKRRKKAA